MKSMAYDTQNLTIDNNYLIIEEFAEDPVEFEVQRAIRHLQVIEEYDIIPSISNTPDWDNRQGKRGIDAKPRRTLSRLIAE